MRDVFICKPKRTAIGSFQGALAAVSAVDLGVTVVKEILASLNLAPDSIDEVIVGSVLTAGQGQAPARQVAIKAGLSKSVQAMTINKVCSSGLKAVMLAANSVQLGQSEAVIAGGMESMSQAPYLLPSLRTGARLGHSEAEDSIIRDGLWDVYNDFHMGNCAEMCAAKFALSREEQDKFAVESYSRANRAIAELYFKDEIVPVVRNGKTELKVEIDEEPGRAKLEKIPSLKPVFKTDGTVTAANASSINDGASAMLVCSESYLKKHSLQPMARIVSQAWAAGEPAWFTTAPVSAVESLLNKTGKKISEIDLFEINEAFSAVALACMKELKIDASKLNVNGGAVALGHPIGASGARILTTLIYSLWRLKKKQGVAAICNGGGEATAVLVEALS